jgi:hypothetical protein
MVWNDFSQGYKKRIKNHEVMTQSCRNCGIYALFK